jgi:uncharacterized membrane protein
MCVSILLYNLLAASFIRVGLKIDRATAATAHINWRRRKLFWVLVILYTRYVGASRPAKYKVSRVTHLVDQVCLLVPVLTYCSIERHSTGVYKYGLLYGVLAQVYVGRQFMCLRYHDRPERVDMTINTGTGSRRRSV